MHTDAGKQSERQTLQDGDAFDPGVIDMFIAQVTGAGSEAKRIAPPAFAGTESGAVEHFDTEGLVAKVHPLRFNPLNKLRELQPGLIDVFDGGGRTGGATDIFHCAAAQAFGGIGH